MMIKNKFGLFLIFCLCFVSDELRSQATFYSSGTIRYERKVNGFRLTEGSWMNRMYEKEKFRTDTFTLLFDSANSLYSDPEFEEEMASGGFWFSINIAPDRSNTVYRDFRSDSIIAVRQLFDEKISIVDSGRSIRWKITGETREIAGFTCQKAVGILHDSLYIVAFYTDQILTKGGPETMGGLPGMIMGLAVPRLYTSWMAISFAPQSGEIKQPELTKKKKSVFNWNTYNTTLAERFSDWGEPYKSLLGWMWGM